MATGVTWIGADNNRYTKVAGVGVKNIGPAYVISPNAYSGLTQIADPNAPTTSVQGDATTNYDTGGSGGGTTSSYTTTAAAPPDLSSYDQSIDSTNSQINNLTPALNNLLQGATNNYQTTVNGLSQQKTSTDQQYHTGQTNNQQDYNGTKNGIRTNTGQTISSVDRMLGAHGGGGQSAGDYAALLAGKAGSQQLTGAGTTFGKNQQALDTNYNDFLNAYNTNYNNAGLQRDADVNNAKANIDTQKANLLTSLASLINQRTAAAGGSGTGASQTYVDQAKQLMSEASTLGAPHPVAAQTPFSYTAPTLDHYTASPTPVTAGGAADATQSATPFYATLLNRMKQQSQTSQPVQQMQGV